MSSLNMGKLFQPITIGRLVIKNRIIMPAISTGMTPGGAVSEQLKAFYVARAGGGAGLIVIRCASWSSAGLWINRADSLPALRELVDLLHSFGTGVFAQIREIGKNPATMVEQRNESIQPDLLSNADLGQIKKDIVKKARIAEEAGFDGVELSLHTGNDLLSRFQSPLTNKRRDEYGGTLENNCRFVVEVIEACKQELGVDYPVSIRIPGGDGMVGGNSLEDWKRMAVLLERAGADLLNVTTGWHQSPTPSFHRGIPKGAWIPLAAEIKKNVCIPVAAGTKLNEPLLAEKALQEDKADLIYIGRGLIADPEFPNKVKEERWQDIRPCISCNHCFQERMDGRPLSCTVNPRVGRETECADPAPSRKRVLVVGGGPAGIEAALTASDRGHCVELWEKEASLGGNLNVGSLDPYKSETREFFAYLTHRMAKSEVHVEYRRLACADEVLKFSPDVVVIATGSSPAVPEIPGIKEKQVVMASDVLLGQAELGQNIVIIGGGFVGCETALFLSRKMRIVTILEKLNRIGNDIEAVNRWVMRLMLGESGIKLVTDAEVVEVQDAGVLARCGGAARFIEADTVVLAVGMKSRRQLIKDLSEKVRVFPIGDCVQPRRIFHAIQEGFRLGVCI